MPGRNGKHTPPRPQIEVSAPGTTPEEAAAIAAALEQFLVETAPPPEPGGSGNPWQRAALAEGIGARQIQPGAANVPPWGV